MKKNTQRLARLLTPLVSVMLVLTLVVPALANGDPWTQTTVADFEAATMNNVQVIDIGESDGSMCLEGGYIYALRGDGSTDFWRYDIATNTWSAMASTPDNVNGGGALVYDGTAIYALRGSDTKDFWRYDIATNTWADRASTDENIKKGGALVYDGTYIYAFRGGDTNEWLIHLLT